MATAATGAGLFALVLVLNVAWGAYLSRRLPAEQTAPSAASEADDGEALA